ncbi:type II secretion system F family protein [Pontimonas sp.]|uniref:type II secretion system F family protein n=1 Tax=Pontimonas sp. TaxID=2304492 RepID=UPI00286FC25B|nr:type II secretion system F family protein [Pontimonas sp.]MDR9397032.1 type II secretion system F family protein [Pontimonas sp.]
MPATPDALGALAVVLGLGVGLGLWSVLATWWGVSDSGAEARVSSPMLRIAHALRDVSAPARAELAPWHIDPVSVGGVIISPAITRLTNGLHLLLGGDAVANRLVEQAGVDYGPEEYRLRRVLWALAGAALGVITTLGAAFGQSALQATGHETPGGLGASAAALLALAIGGVIGAGAYDRMLRRVVAKRSERLAEEFPSILELLSLALAAGESLPGALSRIAQRGHGELAGEWARVMRLVELGEPLGPTLRDSAGRLAVPEIEALVEHLAAALERGAPLAEVVRSHSADSRHQRLRAIVDRAGKAEVWMLVPLVMVILPTTVIFAVWPSLQTLQSGF